VLAFYRAYVGVGQPPEVRAAIIEEAIANAATRGRASFATMCEVAQRFAGWLGLGSGIQAPLEYVFGRWDGRGFPDVRGDAIPLPMRLLHVARDVSLFLSAAGPDEARAVIERRTGTAYEPRLADSLRATSPTSSPTWTRRGCGNRRWRASRFRGSRSQANGSMPPSRPSLRSPVSSRPGFANTRRALPISPRPPPGAWASRLAQPFQLVALLARQQIASATAVCLRLAHPQPQ